jgi:hypothetical protein
LVIARCRSPLASTKALAALQLLSPGPSPAPDLTFHCIPLQEIVAGAAVVVAAMIPRRTERMGMVLVPSTGPGPCR